MKWLFLLGLVYSFILTAVYAATRVNLDVMTNPSELFWPCNLVVIFLAFYVNSREL